MTRSRRVDEATVRTAHGVEVTLLAMDDGSLAVLAPAGTTAWSVVSLFSGATGTRLRMMPRATAPDGASDTAGDSDEGDSVEGDSVEGDGAEGDGVEGDGVEGWRS